MAGHNGTSWYLCLHYQFQYTDEFSRCALELAPVEMPLDPGRIYSFPELDRRTFHGLPGLLADALPDRFGNTLIDLWLNRTGRSLESFSPVERLCYMGSRGTGAMEFEPVLGPAGKAAEPLRLDDLAGLADLAAAILEERGNFSVSLNEKKEEALRTIIRLGTSAGGARPKAVIALNPSTGEVRSGQVPAPEGFEPWLLKFDGAEARALGDPQGYGRIEYAYHLMAVASGIEMSECRLLEVGDRAHFMTRRFDRTPTGEKLQMQSLCALGHYDFNDAGAYGYEQAFGMIQKLGLPYQALEEQYRRMVFNIVARNLDDHTRNVAFLMNPTVVWRLAPAFDVIYAHNPDGRWTSTHQMSVNGKRDRFTREDLLTVAARYGIDDGPAIIAKIIAAVRKWPDLASGVPRETIERIQASQRLDLG